MSIFVESRRPDGNWRYISNANPISLHKSTSSSSVGSSNHMNDEKLEEPDNENNNNNNNNNNNEMESLNKQFENHNISMSHKQCAACGLLITKCSQCSFCKNKRYCNRKHQLAHWEYHQFQCKNKDKSPFDRVTALKGLVGLKNLGNTCYMNASLQALRYIHICVHMMCCVVLCCVVWCCMFGLFWFD